MPYNCGVPIIQTMLQPNKIARTVYPDQPAKDFNEFMGHVTKTNALALAADFEQKFMPLWSAYKRDIQRNSDPKLSNKTCQKCQVAECNSTIQRPTPAYP